VALHGLITSLFLMAFGLGTNLALARTAATGTPEDLRPKRNSIGFRLKVNLTPHNNWVNLMQKYF
jgi:hypothetical protein